MGPRGPLPSPVVSFCIPVLPRCFPVGPWWPVVLRELRMVPVTIIRMAVAMVMVNEILVV